MAVTTLFVDIGGVVLTNGWDGSSRRKLAAAFDLDPEEFEERHDFVVHEFETGRLDLDSYLRRTVFHRDRTFTPDEFAAAMRAESQALPGGLELLADLAPTNVLLAALNNESRELNEHRIAAFDLRNYFDVFLSSCYVGFKKPEPQIFRLAFDITQAQRDQALFIDDRPLNLECAADEGLRGLQFTGVEQLRSDLSREGILPG